MMNLSALEKFIQKLKGLDKMPMGTAVRNVGNQIKDTGLAMKSGPRAALGGAGLGAGAMAAYDAGSEDIDPTEEELMRFLQQRGEY